MREQTGVGWGGEGISMAFCTQFCHSDISFKSNYLKPPDGKAEEMD